MGGADYANLNDLHDLIPLLGLLLTQEKEFTASPSLVRAGLESIVNNPSWGKIFVYRWKGRAVGMVSLLFTISTALGGEVALLEDMIIHPQFRGRGWGKELLKFALKYARTRGLKRVTLLTDSDNTLAQTMYFEEGFEPSTMKVLRWFAAEKGELK